MRRLRQLWRPAGVWWPQALARLHAVLDRCHELSIPGGESTYFGRRIETLDGEPDIAPGRPRGSYVAEGPPAQGKVYRDLEKRWLAAVNQLAEDFEAELAGDVEHAGPATWRCGTCGRWQRPKARFCHECGRKAPRRAG